MSARSAVRPVVCVAAFCGLLATIPAQVLAQATAQPPRRSHVDAYFSIEGPNDSTVGTQTQTTLTYTRAVSQRSQVIFVVDAHDRFDDVGTQINVGAAHAFGQRRLMLSGTVGFGLDVQTIATHEVEVKGQVRVSRHVNPIFEYEFSKYRNDVDVSVVTAGAVATADRLTAQVGVQYTRASIGAEGMGVGVEASFRVHRSTSLIGKFSYGSEHAISKTIREATRSIDALSLQSGVSFAPTPTSRISVSYLYQDRKSVYAVNGVVLEGTFGF